MIHPLGLSLMVLFVTVSSAQPVVHLEGLDRLYFRHVGGDKDRSAVPRYLTRYLPEVISDTMRSTLVAQVDQGGLSRSVEIRDFPLPVPGSAPTLSLRQIVLGKEEQRITELWWTLYDSGRRSDVWHFAADSMTDHKALSNYEIVEAAPSSAELNLRVNASLFRPGGHWWVTGKTLTFSADDKAVRFRRVLNNFGLFHSDSGRETSLDLTLEHETSRRFEKLEYNHIPATAAQACKFENPLDDDWKFDWTSLENQTRCLASRTTVSKRSYRNLDQPSFIERAAKPVQ